MEMRFVADNLNFPGGLLVLDNVDVLVAEMSAGVLTRIGAGGTRSQFARTGGAPTAAALGPDRAIYVCNNGTPRAVREKLPDGRTAYRPPRPSEVPAAGGEIQRVGANGEVSTVYRECEGRPLMAPTNLAFDHQGNFYFSDMGAFAGPLRDPGVSTESKHLSVLRMAGDVARRPAGSIYYASPDGRMITEILHPMAAPNGVALSPDETTLYVGESGTGRVWAFEVPAPGRVGKRRCLGVVPGRRPLNFSWCEGLTVDALGDVLAATVVNGGITTFSPHGGEIEHVATGDPLTSNLCFGGPDGRTLFVTLGGTGRLVAYEAWPTAGHKLNYAL
jgi:gluconolactonase